MSVTLRGNKKKSVLDKEMAMQLYSKITPEMSLIYVPLSPQWQSWDTEKARAQNKYWPLPLLCSRLHTFQPRKLASKLEPFLLGLLLGHSIIHGSFSSGDVMLLFYRNQDVEMRQISRKKHVAEESWSKITMSIVNEKNSYFIQNPAALLLLT